MGKTKIKIQKIEKESSRRVTFNKRKIGLLKKAYEISILCDVDIALIFSSQNGELTCFEGPRSSAEEVVMKFANIPEHERTKSHIQKYTIDEDHMSTAQPRKIENEQIFQAAARKLFESHPGSICFSESMRSTAMDHFHHASRQEMIEEIKDMRRFIGLYDLSLPIGDLVFSTKDAIEMEFYIQKQLQKLQNFKIMSSPLSAFWSDSQKDNRFCGGQNQSLESIYIKQECFEADDNVKAENPLFNSSKTDGIGFACISQEHGATNVDDTTHVQGGWDGFSLDMGLMVDEVRADNILSILPELSESSSDFLPSNIEDDVIDHELFKDNVGYDFFQKDSEA